jgi:hypothetical protein
VSRTILDAMRAAEGSDSRNEWYEKFLKGEGDDEKTA